MSTVVSRYKPIRWFLTDQTRKTMRRPARLVIAPFRILLTSLLPIIAIIMLRVPRRVVVKRVQFVVNRAYFTKARNLLDRNRPAEAWLYFSRCIETTTDPHFFFTAAICLITGLGRYNEGMALFTRANELRLERAKALGVERSQFVFLKIFGVALSDIRQKHNTSSS